MSKIVRAENPKSRRTPQVQDPLMWRSTLDKPTGGPLLHPSFTFKARTLIYRRNYSCMTSGYGLHTSSYLARIRLFAELTVMSDPSTLFYPSNLQSFQPRLQLRIDLLRMAQNQPMIPSKLGLCHRPLPELLMPTIE